MEHVHKNHYVRKATQQGRLFTDFGSPNKVVQPYTIAILCFLFRTVDLILFN